MSGNVVVIEGGLHRNAHLQTLSISYCFQCNEHMIYDMEESFCIELFQLITTAVRNAGAYISRLCQQKLHAVRKIDC